MAEDEETADADARYAELRGRLSASGRTTTRPRRKRPAARTPTGPINRTYFYNRHLDDEGYDKDQYLREVTEDRANLVSSALTGEGEFHAPAIDIDGVPIAVYPSSTPGNSHLYIDKAVTKEQYFRLLEILVELGIVEDRYYQASLARGQTLLRPPGRYKRDVQNELEQARTALAQTQTAYRNSQQALSQARIELEDAQRALRQHQADARLGTDGLTWS